MKRANRCEPLLDHIVRSCSKQHLTALQVEDDSSVVGDQEPLMRDRVVEGMPVSACMPSIGFRRVCTCQWVVGLEIRGGTEVVKRGRQPGSAQAPRRPSEAWTRHHARDLLQAAERLAGF
jgi:hypothetical protein